MEREKYSSTNLRVEMMSIVTVGKILAKNVFAVHGVETTGKSFRFICWTGCLNDRKRGYVQSTTAC